jgi:hypothetical protein
MNTRLLSTAAAAAGLLAAACTAADGPASSGPTAPRLAVVVNERFPVTFTLSGCGLAKR